jgi:hypothetical protein
MGLFGFFKKEETKKFKMKETNFITQKKPVKSVLNDYVIKLKEQGKKPLYMTRFKEEILEDGEMGTPFKANYYRDNKLIFTVHSFPNSNIHLGGVKVSDDFNQEDIKAIAELIKILDWEVHLKGQTNFKDKFILYAVQLNIEIFNPELKEKIEETKTRYEEHLKNRKQKINTERMKT